MSKVKYDWEATAKALRERPGEWAVVVQSGEAPSKRAAQDITRYIKRGSENMPKGEFYAVTREDQVFAVYVGGSNNA